MALAGKAMGVIDTIANLQLVKLYQKDSAIFLQVTKMLMCLCVCVGAVKKLLSIIPCILLHIFDVFILYHNLPVPAAVLALMSHERLLPCSRSSPRLLDADSNRSPTGDTDQGSCRPLSVTVSPGHGSVFSCCNPAKLRDRSATFFIIHALGGAILFITDGIIGSYAGFVYTYAVSPPLLMGHKMAGCLDSIFWAAITVGRLASMYLSYRYTAPKLLTVSLVGVILVQCLLLIFYTSSVFLFFGTCVLGLCISSVFPSVLAFTEDILEYKGCATTVLVTSASTGEMLLQLLVGSVIHSQGSYSFLLCGTVASFIGFCLFLLLLYIQNIHRSQHTGKYMQKD
uniref:Major facilitator superfamily domain containing 4Aa n=1 Tax=Pundamilia nyererei TaxID=303518 RepID=A0A3B4FDU0_9CICH